MPAVDMIDTKAKQNLKMNTIDGAFAAMSDNLSNPFLGLYALSLGASISQIGMLNAFPTLLGNILQLPYGILAGRISNRKALIAIGSLWNRCSWLLIAFLPFLVKLEWGVSILIVLATLRVVGATLGVPAWIAIQAEIVPKPIRSRHYANRNIIMNIVALAAVLFAGKILTLRYPVNYWILFVLAWITGLVSLWAFLQIKVQQAPQSTRTSAAQREKRGFSLRHNKDFAYYCLAFFVWSLGVNLISPLTPVYFIQDLNGTEALWAYVQSAAIIGTILCQRYWGRLTDVFGQKNIMVKAGLGAAMVPFWWFIAPNPLLGLAVQFWGGIMWGGHNLAAFNLLLEVTPDSSRSLYVGVYNALIGLATAGGQLLGGYMAELMGMRSVFFISFVGRLIALVFLSRVAGGFDQPMGWKDLGYPFVRSRRSLQS
ncbi:MAG TPA: MFS transporter [Limnochordia bacterium]|nr:MFS transporter [Limnochordia bacterium]HQD71502.1 MFS transporter [Limnochordia bacterium]